MRRRTGPEAPGGNRRRQFLSDNPNSRYVELRARSTAAAYRRAARRGRDEPKIGENAIPGRLTDNPLISPETAKEKVWKSLEKFGKAWDFLGKIWKSLEMLGAAAIGYATPIGRRRLASEALAAAVIASGAWRSRDRDAGLLASRAPLRMLSASRTLSAISSIAGSPRFARDDGRHGSTQRQSPLNRASPPSPPAPPARPTASPR